jgi:hypothetical protein
VSQLRVLPEVRFLSCLFSGWAAMAEVSRARGSPPLVGRWPQWRQQVSAATCSRAGDSTAVKETAARPAPAVTAASAARAAITLCTRSSAQASCLAMGADRPRSARPVPRAVFFKCKKAVSTCHLAA